MKKEPFARHQPCSFAISLTFMLRHKSVPLTKAAVWPHPVLLVHPRSLCQHNCLCGHGEKQTREAVTVTVRERQFLCCYSERLFLISKDGKGTRANSWKQNHFFHCSTSFKTDFQTILQEVRKPEPPSLGSQV